MAQTKTFQSAFGEGNYIVALFFSDLDFGAETGQLTVKGFKNAADYSAGKSAYFEFSAPLGSETKKETETGVFTRFKWSDFGPAVSETARDTALRGGQIKIAGEAFDLANAVPA